MKSRGHGFENLFRFTALGRQAASHGMTLEQALELAEGRRRFARYIERGYREQIARG